MNEQPRQADTQATRRVKYGFNVAVAAVVAIALVVGVNWLAYRVVERAHWRFDFTVTREYTLSPQTRRVLAQIDEPVQIVTVFPLDSVQLERVDRLAQEYAHLSPNVEADHVDPGTRPTAFYQRINERFTAVNAPLHDAIGQARDALTESQQRINAMLEPLTKAADDAGDSGVVRDRLLEVWTVLASLDQQRIPAALEDVGRAMESPLPDYAGAKLVLLTTMRDQLEAGVLEQVEKFFDQLKEHPAANDAVKNTAIEINEQVAALRQQLRTAQEQLDAAEGSEQYDRLRRTLANASAVVVFKGDDVRVIPVTQMFPDQALLQQTRSDRDARFLGEERLTGALVSLSMDQPPMLVFVVNRQMGALGERGVYNHVAGRLASAGFDVRQWNPQGQMTADGRMVPPTPAPKPADGQRAVWVILPRAAANPMDMNAPSGPQVAELIKDKLEAGDGVLAMFQPDPGARFGASDPVNELLDDWGVTVQLDRVVMEQITLPDRQPQATNLLQVHDWPDDLPVGAALEEMRGMFYQASPVVTGQVEGVEHYNLAVAHGGRLWAERDFAGLERIGDADYDEAEAADSFVIGVAAARGDKRLVVVADPVWASDDITTNADAYLRAPGLADIAGAAYPANAELFVNSVLWLAHMDDLIAASPRSQDIRRVEAMSDGTLAGYRWIVAAGVPAGVLLIGLTVWFVRRGG